MSRTTDVLFVLRGRPGLGHVIPGLAIAHGFARRGYAVTLMTYGNGQSFLERSGDRYGVEVLNLLNVNEEYRDWPGLDLYDHGVREIGPLLAERRPALCIFGGEYVMAPIARAAGVAGAMMFNPEIMEANPRNELPSRLFCKLFEACEHLIPLAPIPPDRRYLTEFEPLRDALTPHGPFCFAPPENLETERGGRIVLIANGGGVNFPRQTTSYSSEGTSPLAWLDETRRMTDAATRAVLENLTDGDRVYVFSCLGDEFNDSLRAQFSARQALEIRPPSAMYYDILGQADLIISRSGTGFIADAQMTVGTALLWGLSGHDEQRQNALELAKSRPATRYCENADELRRAVKWALAQRQPETRPKAAGHDDNVERVVSHLSKSMPERRRL